MTKRACICGCCLVFLAFGEIAGAQMREYEVSVEAGVSATDNIGRTADTVSDPAIDEQIYVPALNFMFLNESQRWDADFQGKIQRNIYENQSFDDETLSTVLGSASVYIIKRRLDWQFTVNHGQQLINPFEPVRPDNREHVTVLSTGPQFNIPVGVRTYITGGGTYTDISYELRPFDNGRASGRLGLMRDISPEKSVSINIDANRIEYDLDFIIPPIDRQNLYLGYDIESARNQLGLKLGWNRVESDGKDGDGILLEMDWTREISALWSLRVDLGSKYSTDGDIFRLNQGLDNNRFNTQDVQNVPDPFRHDFIRLSYSYTTPRIRMTAGIRVDQETYENLSDLDREIGGLDFSIRREFTRKFHGSLFARFNKRNYGATNRSDDDTFFGATAGWNFARTASLNFRVERAERQTDNVDSGYDELRATLTLRYTPLKSR